MKGKTAEPSTAKVDISSTAEEDEFWISFGQSSISETVGVLDERAKFMITTSASLLAADFAVLLLTSKVGPITVTPQFFFAVSALFFMISLFPRRYKINPWKPDETRETYQEVVEFKYRFHFVGFSMFFLSLVLVATSSFFAIPR